MRVYVATAFTNVAEARKWIARLKEVGVTITHDWTGDEMPSGKSELTRPLKEQQELALADIRGVETADVLWLLSPPTGGTGCWFELGVAYGHTEDVDSISSGPRRTIFQAVLQHYETHEQAFEEIVREMKRRRGG